MYSRTHQLNFGFKASPYCIIGFNDEKIETPVEQHHKEPAKFIHEHPLPFNFSQEPHYKYVFDIIILIIIHYIRCTISTETKPNSNRPIMQITL